LVADSRFTHSGLKTAGPTPDSTEIPAAALFDRLLALDTYRQDEERLNLLDWVMSLPDDLDPARAARAVLDYQSGCEGPTLSAPLHRLLDVVSQFSLSRLARFAGERRRSRFSLHSSFGESLT
jgi:hypothetical protein